MPIEYYQKCKDCGAEFGYSEYAYRSDAKRGFSRMERCPIHREQHAKEIGSLANSHFDLISRRGLPTILGLPYLGYVDHGSRVLQERKQEPDPAGMDISVTDEELREIYGSLEKNRVVVLEGPTGSGKSTKVPGCLIDPLTPYELDHFTKHGPIIVTQPRIQATTAIPDTVGKKLVGSSVGPGLDIGYRHGDSTGQATGENWDSRNRLVYVTDGTLVNWIADGKAGDFSIIMVDEAHERSTNIDLILSLLKLELLRHRHLRLIIASATIDTDRFVKFYKDVVLTDSVSLTGQKQYGYERFWRSGPEIPINDMPKAVASKVIELLVTTDEGGILAFLPGENEIKDAVNIVSTHANIRPDVRIFPLYRALGDALGKQATAELDKVKYKGKMVAPRRVVVSTNVAETSITIPDVVYIVDSGLKKEMTSDPVSGRKELKTRWNSKSGCKQRWGRAGRNQPGKVFTLYTEEQYTKFDEHNSPDITRECIDDVLLTAKAAGVHDITNFDWIEKPREDEMKRSLKVMQSRSIMDSDDDFTESGMELYRLARRLSRYLDRFDYNSTSRALDVASLLILADRHSCIIEAATALAMMPRMGASLYWQGDGLLECENQWDLRSKDRIARIHQGLRVRCRDDLEFSLKLFALYEQDAVLKEEGQTESWAVRHFVKSANFELIDQARKMFIEPFTQGKRDTSLRPIEFALVDRVKILMAVAWPDRIVKIKEGASLRFESVESSTQGPVSDFCCGNWINDQRAILGMMSQEQQFIDGAFETTPVASFLIAAPTGIPENDAIELAAKFASIRKNVDPKVLLTRIMADQLAPIGATVIVDGTEQAQYISEVSELPAPFQPIIKEVIEDEDESAEPERGRNTPASANQAIPTSAVKASYSAGSIGKVGAAVSGEKNALLSALKISEMSIGIQWQGDTTVGPATVIGWITDGGQPKIVLATHLDPSTLEYPGSLWKTGDEIDVQLERTVKNMWSQSLVGFIARTKDGWEVPLAVSDLSISRVNEGLLELQGKTIRVLVTAINQDTGLPELSLLSKAEQNLDQLLLDEEAEGKVVDVWKDETNRSWVNCAVNRGEGLIHDIRVPLDKVPEDLKGGLRIGVRVTVLVRANPANYEAGWSVAFAGHTLSEVPNTRVLSQLGVSIKNGMISCAEPLTHTAVIKLQALLPSLKSKIRILYANSRRVDAKIFKIGVLQEEYEKWLKEAQKIKDEASIMEPRGTQQAIQSMQKRIKESQLSKGSKQAIRSVLDDAWKIQSVKGSKAFIERQKGFIAKQRSFINSCYQNIEKLQGFIDESTNSAKKVRWKSFQSEHRSKIKSAESNIAGAEANIHSASQQIRETEAGVDTAREGESRRKSGTFDEEPIKESLTQRLVSWIFK